MNCMQGLQLITLHISVIRILNHLLLIVLTTSWFSIQNCSLITVNWQIYWSKDWQNYSNPKSIFKILRNLDLGTNFFDDSGNLLDSLVLFKYYDRKRSCTWRIFMIYTNFYFISAWIGNWITRDLVYLIFHFINEVKKKKKKKKNIKVEME